MLEAMFMLFMRPGDMIGDMCRMSSDLQYRKDIRFNRIAEHQKVLRLAIQMLQEFLIIRNLFVAHNFDMMEIAF